MNSVDLHSLAKINLGLDVLGKREDGYHELRMIMQTLRLGDTIHMEITQKPGIALTTNLPYLPRDSRNIAWKAADLLLREFHISQGISLHIRKVIPVAAGLAGGSSNAAAVLVGMNRLFHLGLNQKKLMAYGLTLGADVPFCLLRGTALAEGVGEKLTPLSGLPGCPVLLVKPPFHVSTRFVYGNLSLQETTPHPPIRQQLDAIASGNLPLVASLMGNVLEQVTLEAYPLLSSLKESLLDLGAMGSLMSGSGPTVFGLFPDKAQCEAAARQMKKRYPKAGVYQTSFYHVRRKSL